MVSSFVVLSRDISMQAIAEAVDIHWNKVNSKTVPGTGIDVSGLTTRRPARSVHTGSANILLYHSPCKWLLCALVKRQSVICDK